MQDNGFECYYVYRNDQGAVDSCVTRRPLHELPDGEVDIDVAWSSLNYKDALAATGHTGVAGKLPHVPGIDAAGNVVASKDSAWQPGQPVLVTGYELGAGRWGGWAERIRVPQDWVVPLPSGISMRQAMTLGTAGFTAAQCVRELIRNEVGPQSGPIIVTGSTGGVGCLAVKLLTKLGYQVVAATRKTDSHDWLRTLGAQRVIDSAELSDDLQKPLLSSKWAGAVDTVGGAVLSGLIRSTIPNGCVSACGLVGGNVLSLTVYPFILRGVRLAGVSSSLCPMPARLDIWNKLAGPWRLDELESLATVVNLRQLKVKVHEILEGRIRGRVIVSIRGEE
jgi:putative YhdH/YhfP family quinone oxidoreductase